MLFRKNKAGDELRRNKADESRKNKLGELPFKRNII